MKKLAKKMICAILILTMCQIALPERALADVSGVYGDFYVTDASHNPATSNVTYSNGLLTVNASNYTVQMKPGVSSTSDRISFTKTGQLGNNHSIITLDNVAINTTAGSAIEASGGYADVKITGRSTLKGTVGIRFTQAGGNFYIGSDGNNTDYASATLEGTTGSAFVADSSIGFDSYGNSVVFIGAVNTAAVNVYITTYLTTNYSTMKAGSSMDSLTQVSSFSVVNKISSYRYVVLGAASAYGYTVTYDANGGSGQMASEAVISGRTIYLPVCTLTAPAGKVFDQWALGSADGTGYAAGIPYSVTGNVTFYAKWSNNFNVSITNPADSHMTKTTESASENQTGLRQAMSSVVYTADNGYYFPEDYNSDSSLNRNGITVTRNSSTQITVAGTPTADTAIMLNPTVAKSTQAAPAGLSDDGGRIAGTTAAMEYASSADAASWISCDEGYTSVAAGTWYVRYKATEEKYAGETTEIIVVQQTDPDIAIVDVAKTDAQNASYDNMTQGDATDEDAIKAALKSSAETAVGNDDISVTINRVSYTAPIAGTSANPSGTNGSYIFTVTVSKGGQSETTEQKTITITAMPYTGMTDEQAVAAAKTALVDGEVSVAAGASQADRTAAVQVYVNSLLTGDNAEVNAVVTYNSGSGKYDVALSKGSVNDTKSLSMTVNEAPDPDIAIIDAAKTTAQNASYDNMTQGEATDEDAIKAALKSSAETALGNSDILVTINKVSYTAPIAGTSANPSGTDGSYIFTVTVSKGGQSETTEQKTITITPTPYTGITDVQAVNAAKNTLVNGTVDVAFGSDQAAKTAAVQVYVNGLLTGEAAGVNAVVTYNSETGKYDVTLTKGSEHDSESLSMTVNEAPDPDIAIIAAAKTDAQNASYADMTQAVASNEDAIKAALKSSVETALGNSDISVTINKVSYTASVAGTSANPSGTDGSYIFTVTVSKGGQSETTEQKTITITTTHYTGITDVQAVNAAKNTLVNGTVDVAFGSDQAAKTAAVQVYVNGLLTGEAAGVNAVVTYNSETGKYDVALSKGSVNDTKSLSMTVNEAPDPDIAIIDAAKTTAQNASYDNMTQGDATDEDAIKAALKSSAETALGNSDISVTINKVSYTAPIAGTSANPSGTDGSYIFTVTVSKGGQSETTEQKTITITPTAYTGTTDAQAVAAAKTALADGAVSVAAGASQADKTAAVQAYVNSLLTGEAAGVNAVVTYNSETGKYDVALTKGSEHDSESLSMTVNESSDPDIAIIGAAKTAAQNASYDNMAQGDATDEDAIKAALKSSVETALGNSDISATINKVSYTAPIAGTSANPSGTNGSYIFTVTVSKGGQSAITVQKTITIMATPYTGMTDAQAIAAAKTALADGEVSVAAGASQADKTAAVQAYVNGLLTGEAAGVNAVVTYNSETGKYDVALTKGSEHDSESLSMTVNESSDPDIALIGAAKTAAQNASYDNMTQEDATDEDAIKAALKSSAETAVSNDDISVTINKVSYTAPIAGTSANPSGTNGSYIFTVTVSKGGQSETTVQKIITITATPYIPSVIIPPTTPIQTPEPVGERITIDVKQGDSDNTISQIIIERTTDSKGNKSDTVTYNEEQVKETIDKLTKDGKDTARIVIPDQKDEILEITVKIPVNSLGLLKEGAINLQIDTEEAKLYIPKESLEKVNESLYGYIYFNLVPVKKEEQKSEIAKRAMVEVVNRSGEGSSAAVIGVPMVIETNMPSTAMDITLPLTGADLPSNLTEREAFIDQLGIYIEHSDGDKEVIKGELVEFKNGAPGIKFHISKFSIFTIIRSETLKTSTETVKSTGCDVTKVIVPSKAAVTKNKISATVANENSSLVIKVDASANASWKLYSDKACTKVLKQNKLKLKVGENKAYIKVTAEDGKSSKIYTLTITRKEAPRKLIIIATKYDFADAFAAGVLADQGKGKVVSIGITESDAKKMVAYIKKNYTKQDQIYIIGLGQAVYKDLEKMLKKEGYTAIIRIGGKDKYETAKLVADKVTLSKEAKVVLVNGEVKPKDAENIQAVCAELGYPILFVKSGTLTSYTAEALKEIDPTQVYVVGDSSQISSKVVKEITKKLGINSKNIIRINTGKDIK